ncbi:hypothetical protein [Aureimonas sp. SA4125]|uniref:hypothetical protein n=1 Tax=Aureimonas sp. SA4125 TaxID=2826993 RepID=UPI001CC78090|nr:hypothetical protein [Aureimonas sp. SA4125]
MRLGLEIYGTEERWKREIAEDLVRFRPKGKGSMPSSGKLDRNLIRRWASGEKPIPPWVGPALLKLPSIAIARMRAHIVFLRSQVAEFEDGLVIEERRIDAVLRGWVARYAEAPPLVDPPQAKTLEAGEWPTVNSENLDQAHDDGSGAYDVAADLSDDDATARPEHPDLRKAWDAGWREANERHRAAHVSVAEQAKRSKP